MQIINPIFTASASENLSSDSGAHTPQATSPPPEEAAVEFILDAEDRIIRVNSSWSAFARANGAPELAVDAILGKPLLDFISGKVTREYVQRLLSAARHRRQGVGLDYRCDSPTTKRYMRMEAAPWEGGEIRFTHRVMRIEARPAPLCFEKATERGRDTLVRCSACNRLKWQNAWVEGEALPLGGGRAPIRVIYGVCPACQEMLDGLLAD